MAFHWELFLESYGIEIGRRRHRNVGVRCPWCADDPSFHLSISLEGKGYHCWRNDQHAGTSPANLVMALLGCSYPQAAAITQQNEVALRTTDETFADDMLTRLGTKRSKTAARNEKLELLPEFHVLEDRGLASSLIIPYFTKRGYRRKDIPYLTRRFNLHYTMKGAFAYRIIFPVYMNKKLVTWTSRTITNDKLRYMTLSQNPERAAERDLPVALANIKECLFDYDNLRKGGNTLAITEGPFDAMRVTFLGRDSGIQGTCLFSKSVLPAQLSLLMELADKYKKVVMLLDADASFESFSKLPLDIGKSIYLPDDVGDPAELDERTFHQVFQLA